ncbi:hypothetical protein CIPAW_05G082700 [Carya illinoinensis]|uniref:Uncharacterized protein n=1 Tax=Carya illinoinensis TaxID=32201 RepID=A0A8T1QGV1_CARIL|nr:hypothetical protein CIPAW_05G082700 [Carya illinoinensis]
MIIKLCSKLSVLFLEGAASFSVAIQRLQAAYIIKVLVAASFFNIPIECMLAIILCLEAHRIESLMPRSVTWRLEQKASQS